MEMRAVIQELNKLGKSSCESKLTEDELKSLLTSNKTDFRCCNKRNQLCKLIDDNFFPKKSNPPNPSYIKTNPQLLSFSQLDKKVKALPTQRPGYYPKQDYYEYQVARMLNDVKTGPFDVSKN